MISNNNIDNNNDDEFSAPEIRIILNIEGNNYCNDCNKINPRWSSILNGIFLCAKCARFHQKFDKKVSIIKSLEADLWTKEELNFIKLGGNKRFNSLLHEYNIILNYNKNKENVEYKYYTNVAQYYRNLLKSEVLNENFSEKKPSLEEGIKRIDNNEIKNNNINDINNINNCYSENENNNVINNKNENNNNIENNNDNKLNENDSYKNYNEDKIEIKNPDINSNNYLYPDSSHINLGNDWNNLLSSMGKLWSNVGSKISSKVRDFDFESKKKAAYEYFSDKKSKVENSQIYIDTKNKAINEYENIRKKASEYWNKRNKNNNDNSEETNVNIINNYEESSNYSNINQNNNNINNNDKKDYVNIEEEVKLDKY
jgi:hypothetical protein